MRRRRLPPDTRPNWRDPNLPLVYTNMEGEQVEVSPEEANEIHSESLQWSDSPRWFEDETYNLRRKK